MYLLDFSTQEAQNVVLIIMFTKRSKLVNGTRIFQRSSVMSVQNEYRKTCQPQHDKKT